MAKRYLLALAVFVLAVPAAALGAQANIKLDDKISSMHKAGVGPVIFPHAKHEKLYKCNDCHPKIFSEKGSENNISMKYNMEGKYCGSPNCHNSPKAFALFECARCHTGVKGAAK